MRHGVYAYSVRSSRDIQDTQGVSWVFFDADTGELKLLLLPTGQHAGNTMTSWLFALHEANVFGFPYRIIVCLLELAIVILSVTGIVIWLKKRQARSLRLVVAAARGEMRGRGNLSAGTARMKHEGSDEARDETSPRSCSIFRRRLGRRRLLAFFVARRARAVGSISRKKALLHGLPKLQVLPGQLGEHG